MIIQYDTTFAHEKKKRLNKNISKIKDYIQ